MPFRRASQPPLGAESIVRYQRVVVRGLRLPSGRVIAIGRYMLAALIALAMIVDASPVLDPSSSAFAIIVAYLVFALTIVAVTWNDWWLDARLAGPAHAIDIVTYTFLIVLMGADDSPYFTFFIFILLSAAIRWGWRATSLTAILLISLYLMAGMLVAGPMQGPTAAWIRSMAPVGNGGCPSTGCSIAMALAARASPREWSRSSGGLSST